MSNRLDRAIEDFEDESLTLTLGERIAGLRNALMWNAHSAMKRINKFGIKNPISDDEDYKQTECMKWFKELEKMYLSEIKINKALGKSSDKSDKEFLKKIKDEKGSIGDIVRDLRVVSKNGTNG